MAIDRRSLLLAGAGIAASGTFGRHALAADAMPAGLADAAKKEGKLNVITLPRDWANYGTLMDNFASRYGIKITDDNPDGSSAEELQAIRSLKHQSRGPDVVDVGPAFAQVGTQQKLWQPYKVATWNDIPDDVKDPNGLWYGDYFGVVSFAVNTGVVKTIPRTWADLKKPDYKGMIALNGSPLGAGAAFAAVFAAALGNGGSYDNIQPGIDFFGELAKNGNYSPVAATGPATLVGGQTPIVINWDYLSLGYKKTAEADGKAQITVLLPDGAPPYGGFYCQAISAYAPNPNAAKLWEEYLYSDEGQLGFLAGFAHPIRFNALVAAGKIPDALMKSLPPAEPYKAVKFATPAQTDAAKKALQDSWPRVVKF
jgi:putative spermidine/putrescine transport system substrate-binding protein